MEGESDIDVSQIVFDSEGCATCPQCGDNRRWGSTENLKGHIRGAKCGKQRQKRDKEERDKPYKKKDGSILNFLVPKAALNPPTVQKLPTIKGYRLEVERCDEEALLQLEEEAGPSSITTSITIVERLRNIARNLPKTIPEAVDGDFLAILGQDPIEYDNPATRCEDLWEEVLNALMKTVIGWGQERKPEDVIRRGEKGMDALLRVVEYFVNVRGVNSTLFEAKLAHIIKASESMISQTKDPSYESSGARCSEPQLDWISAGLDDADPFLSVVDSDHEARALSPGESSNLRSCQGLRLEFPSGMSPYTAYPFAIHDKHMVPWDVSIRNGVMTLFACSCEGGVRNDANIKYVSCLPCRQLEKDNILKGIKERLRDGVHPNARWEFHGTAGLHALLHLKNRHIEFYRHRGLNHARALLGKATAISDHKRLMTAVAKGDVVGIDRVIRVGLKQNRGIRGIWSMVEAAAQGLYHPKDWLESECMMSLLEWRLGGGRMVHINQRARGGPSLSYLRQRSFTPPIVPSASKPTTSEVSRNVKATLKNIIDIVHKRVKAQHVVVMVDELATEKRIRWDPSSNFFLGVCREHGERVSLEFNNEGDLEQLFAALDEVVEEKRVHYAAEATIAALGILCDDHRIYPARPILISGDCKQESGEEHSKVIQTLIDGINTEQNSSKLRIVSLASDGESRRGLAFVLLTFKTKLAISSPIYPLLFNLVLMDLHVGPDDLTCDKDWKHIIKRFRNLLLRLRGVVICGKRITPSIIKDHLSSEGATEEHLRSLFNPSDQQDVETSFNLLQAIWTLPFTPTNPHYTKSRRATTTLNQTLGFEEAREVLWILGKLFYHTVFPYLCVDLSLAEQLEHLSAAAHLALVLYNAGKKEFIPTELFVDLMLMIKNAYFCVAKAKVDDPDGSFWIILLGTDRLEELFGILRTMVGNDSNLDILQLVSRITGTTEVSSILARYPHWDQPPRRLKVPAITRDSKKIPDSADHIKPASWRGNVRLQDVTLLTSWRRGRSMVEAECLFTRSILLSLERNSNVDILSPFGVLLVNVPLAEDDVDESQDDTVLAARQQVPTSQFYADDDHNLIDDSVCNRVEVEDTLLEMAQEDVGRSAVDESTPIASTTKQISRTLLLNGKEVSKSRILSQYSKYRKQVSSTDRLRRVQQVNRYILTYSSTADQAKVSTNPDDEFLLVSDPIASLLSCDQHAWLVIGEVNAIIVDGEPVSFIPQRMLLESTVSISYQVLGLRPATKIDDANADWRSCRFEEHTFTVSGSVVQPINPSVSSGVIDSNLDSLTTKSTKPRQFYVFESQVLVALTASLFERLTTSQLKQLPKISPSNEYPYREPGGRACFVCSDDGAFAKISDANTFDCPRCAPLRKVVLDASQGQRVLEHIGSHILYDSIVKKIKEPCGLCLRPSNECHYHVTKGKGANQGLKIDRKLSKGCLIKSNFSYLVASRSTKTSPCSNVPLKCPVCPKDSPAVWRYNLEGHLQHNHPSAGAEEAQLHELTDFEKAKLLEIYNSPAKSSVKRPAKSKAVPLVISDEHEAIIRPPTIDSGEAPLPSDCHSNPDVDPDVGDDALGPPESNSVDIFDPELDLQEICDLPDIHSLSIANLEQLNASSHEQPLALQIPTREQNTAEMAPPRITVEPTERSSRKRTRVDVTSLKGCFCGFEADEHQPGVIKCHQQGCETEWYHLKCVTVRCAPASWVCEACRSSRETKHSRR